MKFKTSFLKFDHLPITFETFYISHCVVLHVDNERKSSEILALKDSKRKDFTTWEMKS
jgi:hypothetical protein